MPNIAHFLKKNLIYMTFRELSVFPSSYEWYTFSILYWHLKMIKELTSKTSCRLYVKYSLGYGQCIASCWQPTMDQPLLQTLKNC
jgi:hypothetical protein